MDEQLLRRLNQSAPDTRELRTNLAHMTMSEWLAMERQRRRAAEDRAGYETQPVEPDEFDGLMNAQGAVGPDAAKGSRW